MAGPAGGSGGGHRSGGGGGGFGGGGHRGGGGFHGGYYGRPYGFGGGLFGGLLGIILLPIIIIVLGVIFLVVNLVSTIGIIAQGGEIVYDDEVFQDYAYNAYYSHFSEKTTSEDGIMILFVNYEDNQELAYVCFAGDNVNNRINNLFGSDSEFGRVLESTVNADNYKYSLSKDLAKVMDHMTTEVVELNLSSSFVKEHDMSDAPGATLIDKSGLNLNEETIKDSLVNFQNETGIPVLLVVDDAESVFGKTMPIANIVMAVITLGVIIFGICFLVSKIRRRNMINNDLGGPNRIRVNSTGRRNHDDFDF